MRKVGRVTLLSAAIALAAIGGCDRPTQEQPPVRAATEPVSPSERQAAPVRDPKTVEPAGVKALADLTGECLRLVLADRPASACKGVVLNPTYTSGRSSFVFFDSESQQLVSFTGLSGDDVHRDDVIVQPVDGITLTATAEPAAVSKTIRAIGACRYSDPFAGRATLSCIAESESGLWAGEFRTDGRPPHIEEFGGDG